MNDLLQWLAIGGLFIVWCCASPLEWPKGAHARGVCWPSGAGWLLAGVLATYLIFLHSSWWSERMTWREKTVQQAREAARVEVQAVAAVMAEMDDRLHTTERVLNKILTPVPVKKRW